MRKAIYFPTPMMPLYLPKSLISLYGIGEKRSAKKILETALKKEPSQNDFLFVRGYFSSLEGNLDAAIRDYTEAIRIDPAFARAFNNRGIAFKTKDALDEAIRDFNEATRIDPTYADAFYNRGNTYQAKADWDTAIRDYTEAIRINPNHKLAKNNLKEVNKLKKNK